jgi:hypothetical protein
VSEFTVSWLSLREPADATARAAELVDLVGAGSVSKPSVGKPSVGKPSVGKPSVGKPSVGKPTVIHDLGCGTGSMGRWLSAKLPGPQLWQLYDQDPALLRHAAATMPAAAPDGSPVTVRTRETDITRLTASDLAGASLVTASALLDLLTADEVTALAAACVQARCSALLTLSVAGRVAFDPADPLDGPIGDAFNAHQRRTVDGRRLLGPDAVDATVAAFARFGGETVVRPSPWRLTRHRDTALIEAWLDGWVGAAAKQDPSLPAGEYLRRRLATDDLSVIVEHSDLFAVL